MNIMVYCQHVLGIGHLIRIVLILQQMTEHRITLILGGPPVSLKMPDHIRVVQLPSLKMDAEFSGLLPFESGQDVERIKEQRIKQLLNQCNTIQPDLLLVELFPFGRNAFRFELLPLLNQARELPFCRIVCSVRDILVERDNTAKFEQRVIDRLNNYFDLLLIHGDPELIRFDETFSRMHDIKIPISYTGYICQPPYSGDRKQLRTQLNLVDEEQLIVVSAGSGSVGASLLKSVVKAFTLLPPETTCRLQAFTGPYISDHDFEELSSTGNRKIQVERFSNNFPAWLSAADLSISMGGYNTTMNLLAAGCGALVYPFGQNQEQKMRAERLERKRCLSLLSDEDLRPHVLAERITVMLTTTPHSADIMLNGATQTAEQLTSLVKGKQS